MSWARRTLVNNKGSYNATQRLLCLFVYPVRDGENVGYIQPHQHKPNSTYYYFL